MFPDGNDLGVEAMDDSVSRGSSFGTAFDAGPPLGFPADLALTRLANQMFGECGEPDSSPNPMYRSRLFRELLFLASHRP